MFRSSNGKRRRRLPSLLLHANASRQSKPQAAALPLKPFCGRGWEKTRLRPARTPFLEIPCQIPGTWCPSPCPSPVDTVELGQQEESSFWNPVSCFMDPKQYVPRVVFFVLTVPVDKHSTCSTAIRLRAGGRRGARQIATSIVAIGTIASRDERQRMHSRESLEGSLGVSQSNNLVDEGGGVSGESRERNLEGGVSFNLLQPGGRRPNLKAESHFPPRPQKGFRIQRQAGRRLDCLLASHATINRRRRFLRSTTT